MYFSIKETESSNLDQKKMEENTTRKEVEVGRRLHQEVIRNIKKLNNSLTTDRVGIIILSTINLSAMSFLQLNTKSDPRNHWKPNNRTDKEGFSFTFN